jgi:hypothetical protein
MRVLPWVLRSMYTTALFILSILVTLAGGYVGAVIGPGIAAKPNDDLDSGLSGVIVAVAGGLVGLIVTGCAGVALFFWLGRRVDQRNLRG